MTGPALRSFRGLGGYPADPARELLRSAVAAHEREARALRRATVARERWRGWEPLVGDVASPAKCQEPVGEPLPAADT